MKQRFDDYRCGYSCPVEATLDVIRGKWKGVIIFYLLTNPVLRFNAIRRHIPTAPIKTVTRQLRELEADGVIMRHVFPEVPPKVEYSLTAFGQSLEPIIYLMRDWGARYVEGFTADESLSV